MVAMDDDKNTVPLLRLTATHADKDFIDWSVEFSTGSNEGAGEWRAFCFTMSDRDGLRIAIERLNAWIEAPTRSLALNFDDMTHASPEQSSLSLALRPPGSGGPRCDVSIRSNRSESDSRVMHDRFETEFPALTRFARQLASVLDGSRGTAELLARI